MLLQAQQAHPPDRHGGPAGADATDPSRPSPALPPGAFRSRAFQDAEDAAIWTRARSGVGFTADVPDAGDILPFTVGNHGIHVERRSDGSLVGRFNKAQHGGCRAVPLQCQTGAKTKCSFTACGYSRDRPPIAAADPDRHRVLDQYLGLRPERLLPVAVDAWGPLVRACLDPAPPRCAWPNWPDVAGACMVGGGDDAATHWMEWNANWKFVVTALAPASSKLLVHAESHASCASPCGVTTTIMFPNVVVMARAQAAWIGVLQPTALDKTICRVRTYGAGEDGEEWREILCEARTRAEAWNERSRATVQTPAAADIALAADPVGRWLGAKVARAVATLHQVEAVNPLYRTDDKGGW